MYAHAIRLLALANPMIEQQFGGVCAADQLPTLVPLGSKPQFFIVNTDPAGLSGSHWVAFLIDRERAEFFDSLGHRPSHYHERFEPFLINNGPRYLCNEIPYQSRGSDTCGSFCLYYAALRCAGVGYQDVLNSFTDNPLLNDSIVTEFVSNILNVRYL